MVKRGAWPASRPRPVMDEKGPQTAPVRSHSLTGSARADAVHNGTVHPPSTHVGTGVTDRDTRTTTQHTSLLPAPQAAQTHAETVAASRARPRCEIPPRCLPARICIHTPPAQQRDAAWTSTRWSQGERRALHAPTSKRAVHGVAREGRAPTRTPPLVISFESAAKAAASRRVSRAPNDHSQRTVGWGGVQAKTAGKVTAADRPGGSPAGGRRRADTTNAQRRWGERTSGRQRPPAMIIMPMVGSPSGLPREVPSQPARERTKRPSRSRPPLVWRGGAIPQLATTTVDAWQHRFERLMHTKLLYIFANSSG